MVERLWLTQFSLGRRMAAIVRGGEKGIESRPNMNLNLKEKCTLVV